MDYLDFVCPDCGVRNIVTPDEIGHLGTSEEQSRWGTCHRCGWSDGYDEKAKKEGPTESLWPTRE